VPVQNRAMIRQVATVARRMRWRRRQLPGRRVRRRRRTEVEQRRQRRRRRTKLKVASHWQLHTFDASFSSIQCNGFVWVYLESLQIMLTAVQLQLKWRQNYLCVLHCTIHTTCLLLSFINIDIFRYLLVPFWEHRRSCLEWCHLQLIENGIFPRFAGWSQRKMNLSLLEEFWE